MKTFSEIILNEVTKSEKIQKQLEEEVLVLDKMMNRFGKKSFYIRNLKDEVGDFSKESKKITQMFENLIDEIESELLTPIEMSNTN